LTKNRIFDKSYLNKEKNHSISLLFFCIAITALLFTLGVTTVLQQSTRAQLPFAPSQSSPPNGSPSSFPSGTSGSNNSIGTSIGFPSSSDNNTNAEIFGGSPQQPHQQQVCTAFIVGTGPCSLKQVCPSGCILQQPIIMIRGRTLTDNRTLTVPAGAEILSTGGLKIKGPISIQQVGPNGVVIRDNDSSRSPKALGQSPSGSDSNNPFGGSTSSGSSRGGGGNSFGQAPSGSDSNNPFGGTTDSSGSGGGISSNPFGSGGGNSFGQSPSGDQSGNNGIGGSP
jgi:hypothetical protein